MEIFNSADPARRYRMTRDCDVVIATTDATVFGGATATVNLYTPSAVELNTNTGRVKTEGFDIEVGLKFGMLVDVTIASAGETTAIVVEAFPDDAFALVD